MCPRPPERVKDSYHVSGAAGAPRSLAQGPDPTLGRSKTGSARRSRGPGLAAGPGLPGAAPGTKERPYLCWGCDRLPPKAPARAREITSGARRPEGGPARVGRSGRSSATPRPSGQMAAAGAEPASQGPPHTSARSRQLIHIHDEDEGRGPGPRPAPRPRARIPPRRRLRPQWGAPGFRLGEGVSTWSRLKNVSFLLHRPLIPALEGVSSLGRQEGRLLLPGAGPWGSGLTPPSFLPSLPPSETASVIILI